MTTPAYERGPITREVNAAVIAGRLVEPDGVTQRIKHATLTSTVVLGVSLNNAVPASTNQNPAIVGGVGGGTAVNLSPVSQYTAVESEGVQRVVYGAACAFGQRIKSDANGKAIPWVSGTDSAAAIIGRCEEPAGITAADQVGLTKLFG